MRAVLAIFFAIPAIFIVFGYLFTRGHYPKKPNGLYGYRTTRSMRSEEAWRFAQERWGRLIWRFGWGLLLASAAVAAVLGAFVKGNALAIAVNVWMGVETIATLATIPLVERALKKRFGK